jgi:hypothetical protein
MKQPNFEYRISDIKIDGPVKSYILDGKVKSSSSRRRKSLAMRRTYRTPQSQGDEAQLRNRTSNELIYYNEPVESLKLVTPVKTGVQNSLNSLDSRFRGNDIKG